MRVFRLILLVLLISCTGQPEKTLNSANDITPDTTDKIDPSEVTATFDITDSKKDLIQDEEHLFGKFFNDRIEFHIVEKPDITILNASVDKMTLYFIDDVLCKKKYELTKDITNDLINSLGSFKFKPFGQASLDITKDHGVLVYQTDGRILNPQLTKYQMKWVFDDRTVIFVHEEDSVSEQNIYEEQLLEYRTLYKSVEKDLI